MGKYVLKGVNDDATTCAVCGKVELQRVMWLAEVGPGGDEIGEPFHAGTTCGARLLGYSAARVRTKARSFPVEVARIRRGLAQMHPGAKRAQAIYDELSAMGIWGNARFAHPLMAEARAAAAEAEAWAAAQPVTIEL